jgi:putative ABC transport system permease protein
MSSIWQDVRFGLRMLRHGKGVTAVAVISLALAIAGNTAVFGLVNALLYRPLPYPEADRLVLFGEREASSPPLFLSSAANFLDWRERVTSFQALGAFRASSLSVGLGDRLEAIPAGEMSPDLLRTLGARVTRGRLFSDDEGRPGAPDVVLVTQDFATRRLPAGRDPMAEPLVLNGRSFAIVGVLSADFEFLQPNLQLWVPLRIDRAAASRAQRDLFVMGRLKDGVTMTQARAEMDAVVRRIEDEHPDTNRGVLVDVLNYRYEFPDKWRRQLYFMLLGVVLAVLLVACVNVANLLLARAQSRQREIALRSAIGAGRMRVLRQLLTESLVLASFGGVSGLALGYVGLRAIASAFGPYLPRFYVPVLDGRVLGFTAGLAIGAGILFGVAPMLASMRIDLVGVLKEGGRGLGGPSRRWLSRSLVVAEIALSLVLLGGAAVMVRSFLDFQHADPGYDNTHLATVPLGLPANLATPEARRAFHTRLLERVRAIPGVASATLMSSLPENITTPSDSFTIDAAPPPPGDAHPRSLWVAVSPEYAAAMKIAIRRGRFIDETDRPGSAPIVVISQRLADRYWPRADPIGQRLTFDRVSRTIVGVVGDVRQSVIRFSESAQMTLYVPLAQQAAPSVVLVARASTDAEALLPQLRQDLSSFDSRLTIGQIQTMEQLIARFNVGLNLFNVILGGFGFLALVLAAIGTYGVLAYDVAQRSHEIGVRLAMGSPRARLLGLFLRQGVVLGVIGLLIGTPGVIAIAVFVRSLLIVFSPPQTSLMVGVATTLFLSTLAASLLPAWRATRCDPASVLRRE